MSDLINRQDAIDAIKKDVENLDKELILCTLAPSQYTDNFKSCIESRIDGLNDALIDIESLPSEGRPTGKWVDDCACSICHWIHEDDNGFALITKYNFCPNCGADMRGDTE